MGLPLAGRVGHALAERGTSQAAPGVRAAMPASAVIGVAICIMVLALGLRAAGLTARALVYDETFSVLIASQPLPRLLALVSANDPHPPLYYLLLHAWLAAFGSGELSVRSLSMLMGTGSVLVTFLLVRTLAGALPAALAAGMLALLPAHVAASQEARMYVLLVLTSTASWWTLAAALDRETVRWWGGYVLAVAATLYSHYFGFLVLIGQAIAVAIPGVADPRARRRWLYASIAASVLFLPWMPELANQVASGRAWPAYRPPLSWWAVPHTLVGFLLGGPIVPAAGLGGWTLGPFRGPAVLAAGTVAAVLAATWASAGGEFPRRVRVFLLASVFGPLLLAFAFSLKLNVYSPRYLIFIAPGLVATLGIGLAEAFGSEVRWWRWAAVAIVGVMLAPNLTGLVGLSRLSRLDDFDWRAISGALAVQARADDVIAFMPGFSRIPVNYYFRGPQPRLALPPDGQDLFGTGEGTGLPEVLAQAPRVWVLTILPLPPALNVLAAGLRREGFLFDRRLPVNRAVLLLWTQGRR